MRQKEPVEFRTPQHPSLGTNHWGGASPMLARNIPKESLEQRYLRLNSIRTRDEIFPVFEDDFNWPVPEPHAEKKEHLATPRLITIRGHLPKLTFRRKKKVVELGSNAKKKSWFPRLDPHKRWPQGWC
ncbi:hypothetical protein TIFTF001_018139 [Ficus carica]|uniref:Uncharacterized protein n=1 Tax=Ficus carica TaxID=3494 RepID=A0AA88ARM5_FICCA|nr:hypothetical protein TIFTF001_018139 [Ficus carica]